MSDLWNQWDTKAPPICSVKTELNIKQINALKDITFNALKTMNDLCVLDKEAAFLSRFLYKHKRVFRHDKGMQNLVKVNQCLKRYLKLNLKGTLLSFKQSIPHKLPSMATHGYLPTKQMLKWVLLRLQAFSQLFARVLTLSKQAGAFIYQKICLGWSLNLSLMAFCMTARLFVLSKFLIAKSIEWYSSFHRCLPFLKETAGYLLGYSFPLDLKQWLGHVDLAPPKKDTVVDNIFDLIDLARDDENDGVPDIQIMNVKFLKSIFKISTDDEEIMGEKAEETGRGVKRALQSPADEDLGVPVDDDDEEVIVLARKKMKKKKRKE